MPEQNGATPNFTRPWHRLVWRVLVSLNGDLLARAGCWFGGGTRVAMELGEFRESVDVDLLRCFGEFGDIVLLCTSDVAHRRVTCPMPHIPFAWMTG